MATRITEGDLLDAIIKYGKALPKRPDGKGWATIEEMAQRKGISVAALRYKFKLALENGMKIEQETGSSLGPNGRLRKATYFREKR